MTSLGPIGPDGRTTTVAYDALARVQAVSWGQPDHSERPEATFAHDDGGDLVSLWPPDHALTAADGHSFEHDASGRVTVYEPPAVTAGATTTRYEYNKDGDPVAVFLPDGAAVRMTYDALGRLERMQTPEWEQLLEYDGAGRLVDVEGSPSGFENRMSFVHNGALLVSQSWSGTVEGSVIYGAFDDQLTPRESCVGAAANGICEDGTAVDVERDEDGLVERVGDLDLALDSDRGLVTGATLGQVATTFGYNPFWELTGTATTSGGVPLLAYEFERDDLGRIVQREETVGSGAPEVQCFFYDVAGRLTRVAVPGGTDCGGAVTDIAEYTYDENGNPLSVMENGTTITAAGGDLVFDRQDRLLRYGDKCFDYNPRGQLRRKFHPSTADLCDGPEEPGATAYDYDALGGLKSVRLPGGPTVHYELDPLGRRIGRREDGVWTARYLYGDAIQIVAQLTPDGGAVQSRFVYATKAHSPDYVILPSALPDGWDDPQVYRIVSDHLGSPRFVVHADSGCVCHVMAYDVRGRVTTDDTTGAGLQALSPQATCPTTTWDEVCFADYAAAPIPFRFAGGLWDEDTGLVRFGARDYDPAVGRWTAKDPIGFGGGDSNLFGYVAGDAVNRLDPTGLWEMCPGCMGEVVDLPMKQQLAIGMATGVGILAVLLDTAWDVGETIYNTAVGDWVGAALSAAAIAVPLALDKVRLLRHVDDVCEAGPKLLGPGMRIDAKIEKQMVGRGWSRGAIQKLIDSPYATMPGRDTRHLPGGVHMDDPATFYINQQGHYVLRNDLTGDIVQISNHHSMDWLVPWK